MKRAASTVAAIVALALLLLGCASGLTASRPGTSASPSAAGSGTGDPGGGGNGDPSGGNGDPSGGNGDPSGGNGDPGGGGNGGPWLIKWLVALGPGAPGGNHNVRLEAFKALQSGHCAETIEQGKLGKRQEKALYRGVGSACLAAFDGRTALWSQAEDDFRALNSKSFDFTCYDRAAFAVFSAIMAAHRDDPNRGFRKAEGAKVSDSCPRMTSVNPDHGSVAGGYEVTITGENFLNQSTVWIDWRTSIKVAAQDGGRRLTFIMPPFEEEGTFYLIVEEAGADTGLEFTFETSEDQTPPPTTSSEEARSESASPLASPSLSVDPSDDASDATVEPS